MASITSGIIRFCRPLGITEIGDDVILAPSNLGGVVFAIDILHDEQRLDVGFSICQFDDNFNKKLGTELALKNLRDGSGISIPYNPELSLLENIIHAVDPNTEVDTVLHSSTGSQKRYQTLQRALFTTISYSDYIYEEFSKFYNEQEQTLH
jgi:hypothetical protein